MISSFGNYKQPRMAHFGSPQGWHICRERNQNTKLRRGDIDRLTMPLLRSFRFYRGTFYKYFAPTALQTLPVSLAA